MMTSTTNLKLAILAGLTLLIIISCSSREGAEPPPAPESPVGDYVLTFVRKSWTVTVNGGQENMTTFTEDCDFLSTFAFLSDNTFEFRNHNVDANDTACADSELIRGSWMSSGPISGSFAGDLTFNDTFQGNDVYFGRYQRQNDISTIVEFSVTEEGQEFNYDLVFRRE